MTLGGPEEALRQRIEWCDGEHSSLPLLRRAAGSDVRRPRNVAAGELVRPTPRTRPSPPSRSTRCARWSASLFPRATRGSSRRPTSSPTTPTSRRISTQLAGALARLRDRDDRDAELGPAQSGRRARFERRLPVAVFPRARDPVLGDRAGRQRRQGGPAKGIPTHVDFFGVETARAARRATPQPTCCSATTSWPTFPTSTTSSRA